MNSMKEEEGSEVKEGSRSQLKDNGSFKNRDMLFRADQIDLKSLDIQLEKKLSKIWLNGALGSRKPKDEWEIDLSKLEIRYVVARGTYGTVYRGIHDGQDVAVSMRSVAKIIRITNRTEQSQITRFGSVSVDRCLVTILILYKP